jgi:hypothetical protein
LKTRAMDRDYNRVMSVSPLKHRVDLDVEVSPIRAQNTTIRVPIETQRTTLTP